MDIIGPHKWPGFLGEGKETLAYGRAATAFLPEGTQGSHARKRRIFVGRVGWRRPVVYRSATGPGYWSRLAIRGSARTTNPSTRDGEFTVVQTLAIRLLPAFGAWTDQVCSGRDRLRSDSASWSTSRKRFSLNLSPCSALVKSVRLAAAPCRCSGRVRQGCDRPLLATSPTSQSRR